MHLKNLAHMQSYFSGDLRRSSLEEWIMKLVTDIKLIEKLAAEKEDHNWRFRCFLKGADIDIEELDAIVHKLYNSVVEQIDCQTCGNCCRIMHPILKQSDIKRLASHLSMSQD